ncbi:MAG: hypothetical protein AAFX99_07415, partial [Myxococcota bacterium]
IAWRPMKAFTVGLRGIMKGNRYHLDEEAFEVSEAEVAYSVIQAGPMVTYHANRFLHVEVTGGWTIQRRVEILLSDQTLDVSYLENSAFVGARIRIGLSGWRSDKEAMEAESKALRNTL